MLAAANQQDMFEVVTLVTERAQQPPQHPALERHGERSQNEKDEQRPSGKVELLVDKEECQQHGKQQGIAAQQQAKLGKEIFGAKRVVQSHQAI